ncbi:MAG TPA: asparagine synthase (glutamine-hydrolyzing) [Terriglobales bacterium]|nr:asparagine synthase (glutamine-hydrolyzing) [Terriglobales bacterium]
MLLAPWTAPMCGIAGILNLVDGPPPDLTILRRMGAVLQHRGPDRFAIERDRHVGLVARRLAIVDVAGGHQPYRNEDDSVIAVFNGEIFNYPELHRELVQRGHRFATHTDGEVLVHLYEEHGEALCERLNGQFALALWDTRARRLLLARDRLGICPLFYRLDGTRLCFASEIKALFADASIERRLDPCGIDHAFTFWAPIGARTAFANVKSLPAGHRAVAAGGRLRAGAYWTLPLPAPEDASRDDDRAIDRWSAELRHELERSVRLRLQSDVPVGTYLSGGLDSSAVTYLAARAWSGRMKTFSIAFDDPWWDESAHQERMARAAGTDHHVVRCSGREIGAVFPEVVRHAEAPLVRTAPAPLYLLSQRARAEGIKVVLVGEGADEVLLGYHLYKAVRVQEWLASGHASMSDEGLLRRVLDYDPYYHPGHAQEAARQPAALYARLSRAGGGAFGLHELRWSHMAASRNLYSAAMRAALAGYDARDELRLALPAGFERLPPMPRAQLLDVHTLLSGYLLAAQGDRMSMSHSVEARVPFLDHHLIEFLARVPDSIKMRALDEKHLLKHALRDQLPEEIRRREKQAYTAPAWAAFSSPAPDYVDEVLSARAIEDAGCFDPRAVADLREACRLHSAAVSNYFSAFVAVLSVQLLDHLFVRHPIDVPLPEDAEVAVRDRGER